jgi:hypothetical protein
MAPPPPPSSMYPKTKAHLSCAWRHAYSCLYCHEREKFALPFEILRYVPTVQRVESQREREGADLGKQDLNKTTAKTMILFLHIPLINA